MNAEQVQIDSSWCEPLRTYLESDAFDDLTQAIKGRQAEGAHILPPRPLIFNAFAHTKWENLKVVLLGQDPYHRIGQAMGLSFSVPRGVRVPPSLRNIYKELQDDLGCTIPNHGDLTSWADQGILLLNAMLTVEEGKAGSHKKLGWQGFTDAVIQTISEQKEGVLFLLWGKFAQSKATLIDENRHHVLQAAHPSPLARGAFFGSKHFSTTNRILREVGKEIIQWQIQ